MFFNNKEEIVSRPSAGYHVFWGIWWAAALGLILALRGRLTGGNHLGMEFAHIPAGVWPVVCLAAVIFSALFTRFFLYRKYKGREASMILGSKKALVRAVLIALLTDIYAFLILEIPNNPDLAEMSPLYMAANIGTILAVHVMLLCLFNSMRLASIAVLLFWSMMSAVFYFVMLFRGSPFQLIDLFSAGTAMQVVKGYRFKMSLGMCLDLILGMCALAILIHMPDSKVAARRLWKVILRAVLAGVLAAMVVLVRAGWYPWLEVHTDLYLPERTYREFGTTIGFVNVAEYMRLTPPDGYTPEKAEAAAKEASGKEVPNTITKVKPVNIIVIMNESWMDLRYAGKFQTNKPVMPFYDSLKKNTVKGHNLVSIFGGGTAKTEYEFLTGNSVKRFPGMVPYVSYFTHDEYSLVSTLEAQGFQTAAMHPYVGTNWKRSAAYPLMGFDRFYTEDDFDLDVERLRNYISDRANFEKIVQVLDSRKDPKKPFFLFDVTMQNHGSYQSGWPGNDVRVKGYYEVTMETYLSLARRTDQALEYLVRHYEHSDQPTLIVMFGDHSPAVPDTFTEFASGAALEDLPLAKRMKYYTTPFLIWANYDIPEKEDVLTSSNFLGTMMMEYTGYQMADYNYYLKNLMEEIPALNTFGYYDGAGNFHSWEKGTKDILAKELTYEQLQYNNLGKVEERLDWFFGPPHVKN